MKKYKHMKLKGNNASKFFQAVEQSKENKWDYKKHQEKNLYKLKLLSETLNKSA